MGTSFIILKHAAKVVPNVCGAGIGGDLLIDALPEIAQSVWTAWTDEAGDSSRRAQLQALAGADESEVRQAIT